MKIPHLLAAGGLLLGVSLSAPAVAQYAPPPPPGYGYDQPPPPPPPPGYDNGWHRPPPEYGDGWHRPPPPPPPPAYGYGYGYRQGYYRPHYQHQVCRVSYDWHGWPHRHCWWAPGRY